MLKLDTFLKEQNIHSGEIKTQILSRNESISTWIWR